MCSGRGLWAVKIEETEYRTEYRNTERESREGLQMSAPVLIQSVFSLSSKSSLSLPDEGCLRCAADNNIILEISLHDMMCWHIHCSLALGFSLSITLSLSLSVSRYFIPLSLALSLPFLSFLPLFSLAQLRPKHDSSPASPHHHLQKSLSLQSKGELHPSVFSRVAVSLAS